MLRISDHINECCENVNSFISDFLLKDDILKKVEKSDRSFFLI